MQERGLSPFWKNKSEILSYIAASEQDLQSDTVDSEIFA